MKKQRLQPPRQEIKERFSCKRKEPERALHHLVFVFIEEKVILAWIVRPDILDPLVGITFILYFSQIFNEVYFLSE